MPPWSLSTISHEAVPEILSEQPFVLQAQGRATSMHVEATSEIHQCPGCSEQLGVSCSFALVKNPVPLFNTAASFKIVGPARVHLRD